MSDPRNRQYTNGEITVFWKPAKCIHATTCFRELIEVFNPGRRPWINMEGAPTRRIIEVVNKCPTQAIAWKRNSDLTEEERAAMTHAPREEVTPETLKPAREKAKPVKVQLMKDGPIVVEGDFQVIGAGGQVLKTMLMTSFCRCGNSKSQPFCDGTHRKVKFSDAT